MLKKLWAGFLALLIPPPLPPVFAATITNVVDADSLEIQVGWHRYNCRLVGIDGPEYGQEFGPEGFFGLVRLAYKSRTVQVENFGVDKFNRMLVRVTVGGVDVALSMLREGLAWHIPTYSQQHIPLHSEAYRRAAHIARASELGIWSQSNPVHPAQYRAEQRGKARPANGQYNLFS
jgi:micrococcal nuclease